MLGRGCFAQVPGSGRETGLARRLLSGTVYPYRCSVGSCCPFRFRFFFIFLCFKEAMLFAMSKSPSIVLTRLDIQRLDEMLDTLDGPADLLDALENEIQRAKVVGHDRVGADIVTMNSRVRF